MIALVKLVAAVVVVSLEVTRILVVMLLIVALNVPAVPAVPPSVIVLTWATGTRVVFWMVEDESWIVTVVVPCEMPVTEREAPSALICAVAMVLSGFVAML